MRDSKRNRIIRQTLFILTCLSIGVLILVQACQKPERMVKVLTLDVNASDISYTSVLVKGKISDLGTIPIDEHGIYISENQVPIQNNSKYQPLGPTSSKDTFVYNCTGLSIGTKYYYRAYAYVNSQPSYGDTKFFTTKVTDKPELITTAVSNITLKTATSGGSVTSDGGETVTKKGLCWSKSAGTDLSNALDTTINLATGSNWTDNITGLDQGTKYYVRSYAVNAKGTGYGNELSFTALLPSSATTLAASSVTVSAATLNGTVNANNSSAAVTFEYGLTTSYGQSVTATPGTVTGNTVTNVSAGLSGLTQGTTYHFRVRSVSLADTVRGGDLTFTTLTLPSAATVAATQMTGTSAQLNGSVNANGSSTTVTFEYGPTTSYGTTVTATQSPVTGSTLISVSAALTGLTQGTTYHFRVKAVSTAGTVNGNDQSFITPVPPSATTAGATGMGATTATLNGTVNANNSSTVVTFEYGLTASYGSTAIASQSPVTGNTLTNVSAGVSGLTASTTYHFRLKAVSAGGTVYGDDFPFTTSAAPVTVTDYDGNVYDVIQIGSQYWLKENIRTTSFFDGTPIAWVTNIDNWGVTYNPAFIWINNNQTTSNPYGGLYNWFTANSVHNVCFTGWHVPTKTEWETLLTYAGGLDIAGGKLREAGTDHWLSPNTGATNDFGFSCIPGGYLYPGQWQAFPVTSLTWCKDESSAGYANRVTIYGSGTTASIDNNPETFGMSIRCIKGELPLTETDSATAVASTSVTLNGKVNPNGVSTLVSFEYGPTSSYGSEISASQSPISGSVPVSVNAGLSGLTPGNTCHYRVKAVNSGGTSYGSDMTFTCPQTVSDYEGNIYNTVIINKQVWMQQNLKSTKYSDGTSIPVIWTYGNDQNNVVTYGYLYSWDAVMNGAAGSSSDPSGVQGTCPTGWHVPSLAEWGELDSYLGNENGGKLKEAGLVHWANPNTGATNTSGFTGLPGGVNLQNPSYGFMGLGIEGLWWTSTDIDAVGAWCSGLYSTNSGRGGGNSGKANGYSIRCLKN